MIGTLIRVGRIAFKLLFALTMFIVVVGAAYWAWSTAADQRLEQKVAKVKQWESDTVPALPLKYTLKTRCSEERLYYSLSLEPVAKADTEKKRASAASSPPGEARRFFDLMKKGDWSDETFKVVKQLNIDFEDSDGFNLFSVDVPLDKLLRSVGEDGVVRALEANANVSCNRSQYARATTANVQWRQHQP